jgi:hypothetical protein
LNPEIDYFANAKRKLRLVLSTSDCHACDVRNNNVSFYFGTLIELDLQSNFLFPRDLQCPH